MNNLLTKLKLTDYILSGFCLGAVIVIRMLEQNVVPPSQLVLFEALYDANYFRFGRILSLVVKLYLRLGSQNRVLYAFTDFCLHSKRLLRLYFRFVYRHEADLEEVIEHQIKLTDQMNTRVWIELINDIFRLNLGKEQLCFEVPTYIVYNSRDDLIDLEKTIVGIQQIIPNSKLVRVDITQHAPSRQITEADLMKIISPITPILKSLKR